MHGSGRQLSAGGCRECLFGVVALLGVGLAGDHAQRPGHGEAAPGDGLEVKGGFRISIHTLTSNSHGTN